MSDKPNFFQIVLSTLAAAFGVQSKKNLERDTKHGNISHYIVAGIIFMILFVLTVSFIVKQVLRLATA
ncbi:DUF2970 domain-containing protein [Aurantivibrio infirmus]